jgi:SAM-dependent methyltransferase
MTPEMVRRARANQARLGLDNIEFRVGQIEDLPLEGSSVDVVLSNCVINLVYEKQAVFHEAMRVLRPGGRLVVSDIVSSGRLPEEILNDPDAWAACIAGAVSAEDYVGMMERAGFQEIEVLERKALLSSESGTGPTIPLQKLIIRGMRADG